MAERDIEYMQKALAHAANAAESGEVPVGALLVAHHLSGDPAEDRVIAESGNLKESEFDPLGHAEIRVLRAASFSLGRWRLHGCTLYVTLEPCVMCAGAIIHSRVDRVVYGARDPKAGAVESLFHILSDPRLNHRPEVTPGILATECGEILSLFFSARRAERRQS
jgi:tRNA(adenine34) deaminase